MRRKNKENTMVNHNNCHCPIGDISHPGDYSKLCPDCLMPDPRTGDFANRECTFTMDKSKGLVSHRCVDPHGRKYTALMWPTVQENYCFYHLKKRNRQISYGD